MNIAVYDPFSFYAGVYDYRNFIVTTLLSIANHRQGDKFFLLAKQPDRFGYPLPANAEIVPISYPENRFLKKIWWVVKLPALLKKVRAELLVCCDTFCSPTATIPQCILSSNTGKMKAKHLKKARLILVPDEISKQQLIEKFKMNPEKITVVHPSGNENYKPNRRDQSDNIKEKYSGANEFFLYNSSFNQEEDLLNLLRSFSHFKKRQKSNFRLLLMTETNSAFEEELDTYKYRADVGFLNPKDPGEQAMITAAAYAVVLPFAAGTDTIAALNAMRSGVPVITTQGSVINEIAGGAVLSAGNGSVKEIGEKMMQLYTDENFRAGLIENAKAIAGTYTNEKAGELIWRSIIDVLH